ncbi:MAG: hypothetical protein AAFN10_27970 [Bacteroidota bacterium]
MRSSRIIILLVIGIISAIAISAVVRSLSKIEPKQPTENDWDGMLKLVEHQVENRTKIIDALKRLKSSNDELEQELATRTEELSQNGTTTATSDATRV